MWRRCFRLKQQKHARANWRHGRLSGCRLYTPSLISSRIRGGRRIRIRIRMRAPIYFLRKINQETLIIKPGFVPGRGKRKKLCVAWRNYADRVLRDGRPVVTQPTSLPRLEVTREFKTHLQLIPRCRPTRSIDGGFVARDWLNGVAQDHREEDFYYIEEGTTLQWLIILTFLQQTF